MVSLHIVRIIHLQGSHQRLKGRGLHPALRQTGVVCKTLESVVDLSSLADHVQPQTEHVQYLVALSRPSPECRKLIPKQKPQDQLCVTPIILALRRGSFSYQNRIADK